MNKKWDVLKEAVILLLILCLGFFLAVNMLNPPLAVKTFGFSLSMVSSDSMEPVFQTGDVMVVKATDVDQLQEGEIIAFSPRQNFHVAHYIADIRKTASGERVFKTRRYDAQNEKEWDYWGIQDQQIYGQYAFKIPKIGHVALFLKTPQGLISFVALVASWLLFDYLRTKE